jgi:hypothetical protein
MVCASLSDPHYGCASPKCVPCAPPNVCTDQGGCTLVACESGYTHCSANANDVCETDVTSDVHNCGICGFDCKDRNPAAVSSVQVFKCVQGLCKVQTCLPDFVDCDAAVSNGCEMQKSALPADHCGLCNGCPVGRVCNTSTQRCELPTDAGTPDSGTSDGDTSDGGTSDGGTSDAG